MTEQKWSLRDDKRLAKHEGLVSWQKSTAQQYRPMHKDLETEGDVLWKHDEAAV